MPENAPESQLSPALAALWDVLHRRPEQLSNLSNEREWMRAFTFRITCDECRAHWMILLQDFPVDYTTRLTYFDWTVEAHNRVNDRLGKARFPLHIAREQYRWPVGDTVSLAPLAPPPPTASEELIQSRRMICLACPGRNYLSMVEGGVHCRIGQTCCGGTTSPAVVLLGNARRSCPAGYWKRSI